MPDRERIDVALVCGGKFHDFDYARLEILTRLQDWPTLRTQVFADYEFLPGRADWDALITYTCDVRPSEAAQDAAREFVSGGGRWLALHGTNSMLDQPPSRPGRTRTPNLAPRLFELLGSRFLTHPPVHEYTVRPVAEHPITRGIGPFSVRDELYCSQLYPPLEVLLATDFSGDCPAFEEPPPPDPVRPVLYLKRTGLGAVCYLTLGHCRGLVDTLELPHIPPSVDHGSWQAPEFRLLVARCLEWAVGEVRPGADGKQDEPYSAWPDAGS
jgi:Trehalose utilisation